VPAANAIGKGHTLDVAPFSGGTSLQRCSGMAHTDQAFYSFTCTPTHVSISWMNSTCLCLPNQSWSSFTNPRGVAGWVGLGTTTVIKQSAQGCYVTDITVVNCSHCHTSLGSWSAEAGVELRLRTMVLTTESPTQWDATDTTCSNEGFSVHSFIVNVACCRVTYRALVLDYTFRLIVGILFWGNLHLWLVWSLVGVYTAAIPYRLWLIRKVWLFWM